MTKKLILLFCVLAMPFAAQARKPDTKVFNAESFTLENGLEVVVVPSHRAPVVTHMVWYKAGAADEPPGRSGIAHFMEHLMFKGSEGFGPGEFSEKIRSLGGNDNAFTGQDYTAYFQSIAAEHLETVMRMEAGRMRGMTLPPEEVESERKVIIEERRQRTDNDPGARFAEQMSAALFVNHPYGTPVIGWGHEMSVLTREDAKTFYDRWYGPNNAILIVSGDVTGPQVHELAKKIYGPLARVDVPPRNRPQPPPGESRLALTMFHADVREPVVQKMYRVPSAHQNKTEALALQVLEEIMGGGPTSRLYRALVVEQKIATSAGLSYRSAALDDAVLYLYAAPAPGQDHYAVNAALEEELRRLVRDGITADELNDAITRMQAEAIYALDSLSGPAMVFGQALATGATIDDVEYWPRDIAAVTAEQVQAAAAQYLDPDNPGTRPPVTGYLLPSPPPAEAAPAAGEEATP